MHIKKILYIFIVLLSVMSYGICNADNTIKTRYGVIDIINTSNDPDVKSKKIVFNNKNIFDEIYYIFIIAKYELINKDVIVFNSPSGGSDAANYIYVLTIYRDGDFKKTLIANALGDDIKINTNITNGNLVIRFPFTAAYDRIVLFNDKILVNRKVKKRSNDIPKIDSDVKGCIYSTYEECCSKSPKFDFQNCYTSNFCYKTVFYYGDHPNFKVASYNKLCNLMYSKSLIADKSTFNSRVFK